MSSTSTPSSSSSSSVPMTPRTANLRQLWEQKIRQEQENINGGSINNTSRRNVLITGANNTTTNSNNSNNNNTALNNSSATNSNTNTNANTNNLPSNFNLKPLKIPSSAAEEQQQQQQSNKNHRTFSTDSNSSTSSWSTTSTSTTTSNSSSPTTIPASNTAAITEYSLEMAAVRKTSQNADKMTSDNLSRISLQQQQQPNSSSISKFTCISPRGTSIQARIEQLYSPRGGRETAVMMMTPVAATRKQESINNSLSSSSNNSFIEITTEDKTKLPSSSSSPAVDESSSSDQIDNNNNTTSNNTFEQKESDQMLQKQESLLQSPEMNKTRGDSDDHSVSSSSTDRRETNNRGDEYVDENERGDIGGVDEDTDENSTATSTYDDSYTPRTFDVMTDDSGYGSDQSTSNDSKSYSQHPLLNNMPKLPLSNSSLSLKRCKTDRMNSPSTVDVPTISATSPTSNSTSTSPTSAGGVSHRRGGSKSARDLGSAKRTSGKLFSDLASLSPKFDSRREESLEDLIPRNRLRRPTRTESASSLSDLDMDTTDIIQTEMGGVAMLKLQTGIAVNKQRELFTQMNLTKGASVEEKIAALNRATVIDQLEEERQKLISCHFLESLKIIPAEEYEANAAFKLNYSESDFDFSDPKEEWEEAQLNTMLFEKDTVVENPLFESEVATLNLLYEEELIMLNPLFEPTTLGLIYQSTNIEYEEECLVEEMKQDISRNSRRVTTFVVKKNVFSGSELVDWVQKRANFHLTREDCVFFAQELMDRYIFKSANMSETFFCDSSSAYYRFVEEHVSDECLNIMPEDFGVYQPQRSSNLIMRRITTVLSKIIEQFSDRRDENDRAERLINHYIFDYRGLSESELYIQLKREVSAPLHKLDPAKMLPDERKAFFINLYNVFILHALIVCGRPTNLMLRQQFFKLTKYIVGRYKLSLDNIYHAILRGALFRNENGERIWSDHVEHHAESSSWTTSVRLYAASKYHDKVLDELHLRPFDKRIHFAMYSGNLSSPKLAIFSSDNIDAELESATKEFISHYTDVNMTTKVITLHKVFEWYRADFAKDEAELLAYVSQYLDIDQRSRLFYLLREENTEGYTVQYHYDWKLNNKINAQDVSLLDKTDIKIELNEVRNDEAYRDFFFQYCELEHSTENLEFWLAVRKYRKIENDRIGQVKEAKRILRTYLLPKAEKEINVSRSLVVQIEATINEAAEKIRIKSRPTQFSNSSRPGSETNLPVTPTDVYPVTPTTEASDLSSNESCTPTTETPQTITTENENEIRKKRRKELLLPTTLFDKLEEEIETVMTDTFSRFKNHDLYTQMVQTCVTEFIYDNMSYTLEGEDASAMNLYEAMRAAERERQRQEEEREKQLERERERKEMQQAAPRFKSFISMLRPAIGEDVTMSEQEYLRSNPNFEKRVAKKSVFHKDTQIAPGDLESKVDLLISDDYNDI